MSTPSGPPTAFAAVASSSPSNALRKPAAVQSQRESDSASVSSRRTISSLGRAGQGRPSRPAGHDRRSAGNVSRRSARCRSKPVSPALTSVLPSSRARRRSLPRGAMPRQSRTARKTRAHSDSERVVKHRRAGWGRPIRFGGPAASNTSASGPRWSGLYAVAMVVDQRQLEGQLATLSPARVKRPLLSSSNPPDSMSARRPIQHGTAPPGPSRCQQASPPPGGVRECSLIAHDDRPHATAPVGHSDGSCPLRMRSPRAGRNASSADIKALLRVCVLAWAEPRGASSTASSVGSAAVLARRPDEWWPRAGQRGPAHAAPSTISPSRTASRGRGWRTFDTFDPMLALSCPYRATYVHCGPSLVLQSPAGKRAEPVAGKQPLTLQHGPGEPHRRPRRASPARMPPIADSPLHGQPRAVRSHRQHRVPSRSAMT